MITRRDCLLLLSELEARGVDVGDYVQRVMRETHISSDIIKFINDHRMLEVTLFYEKIRKNYNQKKSQLYKNIVISDEVEFPQDVLTTLASLSLQILLFARESKDQQMFMQHARFQEIQECLLEYSKTYDLIPCINLLKVIKIDMKALEYITK